MNKYSYYFVSSWEILTSIRPLSKVLKTFFANNPDDVKIINLKQPKVQFMVRSAMDIWSVKETFLDKFYERFGTPIGPDWTILDIGGGIGDFSIYAAKQFPKTSVYTYEPTPESFRLLEENLRINNVENVIPYKKAIWSTDGKLTLDISEGEPIQYKSKQIEKHNHHNKSAIEIESISLENALNSTGVAICNLLKIDCEGAEYEILFNAPEETLERIERIVMEYHDSLDGNHQQIFDFLTDKGFGVQIYPNFVHHNLGYLYASR